MKYIRTKSNHIYKTLGDFMQVDLPQSKIRVENVNKGWHVVIYKSEIIKQSDTIEELLDEFVVEANTHNVVLHDFKSAKIFVKDFYKYELVKDYKIYGAIWTDKGLIYVAKMNEKGEKR